MCIRDRKKNMKRKKLYTHAENKAEQLVKTASKKRCTYVYRFYGVETVGNKSRKYVEEIELIPGAVSYTHLLCSGNKFSLVVAFIYDNRTVGIVSNNLEIAVFNFCLFALRQVGN